MTSSPEGLVPAPHLRTVRTAHSVVLVNYLDGTITLLTGGAELAWLSCLDGAAYPSDDTRILDWIRKRWLIPGRPDATTSRTVWASDPTTSWGTQEALAYLPAPAPSPWRWRLAAIPALAMVLTVQHLGHRSRRFHRLLRLCRLGTRLPPASSQQAHDAIRAVRWAARLIPARIACSTPRSQKSPTPEQRTAVHDRPTHPALRRHPRARPAPRRHAPRIPPLGKRPRRDPRLRHPATAVLGNPRSRVRKPSARLRPLRPKSPRTQHRRRRAYSNAGFRHAGQLRHSGHWLGQPCDEILMDALPTDLTGPSAVLALTTRPPAHTPEPDAGQTQK
ncbi:MAG: hypothetical protein ACRDRS_26960 [Pseudonocardiaceae bacterium]